MTFAPRLPAAADPRFRVFVRVHDAAGAATGWLASERRLQTRREGGEVHAVEVPATRDSSGREASVGSSTPGGSTALNIAVDGLPSEYFVVHDWLGISVPGRFSRQVAFLDANPDVGVVGCASGTYRDASRVSPPGRIASSNDVRIFLKGGCLPAPGSLMFRRSVFLAAGGIDPEWAGAEFHELLLRVTRVSRLEMLPEVLYHLPAELAIPMRRDLEVPVEQATRLRARIRADDCAARAPAAPIGAAGPPAFTVMMANYNNARFIREAIDSVLAQSFTDWELLILDDASTDDSIDAITPYLADPRIRLIRLERNQGYIAACNRLWREARSELVGTLDSDDALTHDAIDRAVQAHRDSPGSPMVYSQFLVCDARLRPFDLGWCRAVEPGSSALETDCAGHFRTFKRAALDRVGGFDPRILYAEDKDIIYRMEELGPLAYVDEALYLYRVLEQTQSRGTRAVPARVSMVIAEIHAHRRRLARGEVGLSAQRLRTRAHLGLGLALHARDLRRAMHLLAFIVRHRLADRAGLRTFINALHGSLEGEPVELWHWKVQRRLRARWTRWLGTAH